MAQPGDTITFTFSNGTSEKEDVSSVGTAVVDFCNGSGGQERLAPGEPGGRVESATIDVSSLSEIYIWVGGVKPIGTLERGPGRYEGGAGSRAFGNGGGGGGGSTEIAAVNTDSSNSADEPFLVAAGGGSGTPNPNRNSDGAGGGARGGAGNRDEAEGEGTGPPLGGDGGASSEAGDGAIDDQNRGLVSGGTITKGGGSPSQTNGEVQISFQASAPAAPSNLSLTEL
jgi:hypothetical protein